METFTSRQLELIASPSKTVYWNFIVTDNLGYIRYWSTSTNTVSGIDATWNQAFTFKVLKFSGLTLRRNKSESGIHASNDLSFTISNSTNSLYAPNFMYGSVTVGLIIDDGLGKGLCGSWQFLIKSASPYDQQIDLQCEDFVQSQLKGSYPNTRLVGDIFPHVESLSSDNMCVPEPYGTCYIPLRSVYAVDNRYYCLGPSTYTYNILEIRSPRSCGSKISWVADPLLCPQTSRIDSYGAYWGVFQALITEFNQPGAWLSGGIFLDMPTKFTRSDTATTTNPADIINKILNNMGITDTFLDLPSFATAKATFTSWGLAWNFAFFYKEDRIKVLANLLTMCHSALIVGSKLKLQVLSAVSKKNITSSEVIKTQESGVDTFHYQDSLAQTRSDSAYIAFQQMGESQDAFLKALISVGTSTVIDSEVITFAGVQDTQQVQKLGILYYQRKFLQIADISAKLKGTCLALRPDDVITINYADYGGTYNVLIDEMTILPDAAIDVKCIRFSIPLSDWADLSPGAITYSAATDSSSTFSPVITGPDTPGGTGTPSNFMQGRLRVGNDLDYLLLDPTYPLRMSLYSSNVERVRIGNLNGFLGFVSTAYGIAIGDNNTYLKYDPFYGLRIGGSITASGTIGGWTIQPTLIQSNIDGSARIELDQAKARISILDSTNFSKVAMGYLDGLTKHDGSGYWGPGDYGFWAVQGDQLRIDGDVVYKSGDWIVENDGAYLIQNGAIPPQTIVRLGTVAAVKGLYIYDTTTPVQNLIASFTTAGFYLGEPTKNITYTPAGGLVLTGVSMSLPYISSFYQDAIPTSLAIGDLWYDTDNGDKLYRAASVGADEIKTGEWVAVPVDFANVNGTTKPANNATVGAAWGTNLSNIPSMLETPAGTGLFISATHMGYYTSSVWKTYMDSSGNFLLGDIAGGNAGVTWNQSGGTLSIIGSITATAGYFQAVTLGSTGVASGTLTLQIWDGHGDTYIAAGKTDFATTNAGFILGLDDSDSNKAKFYFGNSTTYLYWDGTNLVMQGPAMNLYDSSVNAAQFYNGPATGYKVTIHATDQGLWCSTEDGLIGAWIQTDSSNVGSIALRIVGDKGTGIYASAEKMGITGVSHTEWGVYGISTHSCGVVGVSTDSWDIYTVGTTYGIFSNTNIYATTSVSAASYITRSPHFDGDALSALKMFKKGENGKIDHTSLPDNVRVTQKIKRHKPDMPSFLEREMMLKECRMEEYEAAMEMEEIEEEGQDLTMTIAILVRAVQQLTEKIETLEKKGK